MPESLATLCAKPQCFDSGHIVFHAADSDIVWSRFWQRVREKIDARAHLAEREVALFLHDSGDFLETLFALWCLGKTVILPGDTLPATLNALTARTGTFDGDFPDAPTAPTLARPLDVVERDHRDPAVVVFTSGSSGQPRAVAKTFAQLDAECEMLEGLWGAQMAAAPVLGSVSHQHMYGLVFRVLWPFVAGRPFYSRELGSLANLQRHCEGATPVLISSPVHLRHVSALIDDAGSEASACLVFSSGAALPETVATSVKKYFSAPVVEIYGSTESGAAAWREQPAEPIWQTLPGVRVAAGENSQLRFFSPALPDAGGLLTADMGHCRDSQHFELSGRVDRIVKVGGKRISLSAMEQALLDDPWIAQACLCQLAEKSGRIAAVVQLNAAGRAALIDRGKRALNQRLLRPLRDVAHPAGLPRYWRYVNELPRNPQGKLADSQMQALFSDANRPLLPDINREQVDSESATCQLSLRAPPELQYFDGHFPARPVLPGVVQVDWAIHYGRQHLGACGDFSALEALKFHHVITPDTLLQLQLEYSPEKNRLLFRYLRDGQVCSSGRVIFATEAAQ